jgi:hypothetical protein
MCDRLTLSSFFEGVAIDDCRATIDSFKAIFSFI